MWLILEEKCSELSPKTLCGDKGFTTKCPHYVAQYMGFPSIKTE